MIFHNWTNINLNNKRCHNFSSTNWQKQTLKGLQYSEHIGEKCSYIENRVFLIKQFCHFYLNNTFNIILIFRIHPTNIFTNKEKYM